MLPIHIDIFREYISPKHKPPSNRPPRASILLRIAFKHIQEPPSIENLHHSFDIDYGNHLNFAKTPQHGQSPSKTPSQNSGAATEVPWHSPSRAEDPWKCNRRVEIL